jgi:hypothetical protein
MPPKTKRSAASAEQLKESENLLTAEVQGQASESKKRKPVNQADSDDISADLFVDRNSELNKSCSLAFGEAACG